MSDPSTPSRKRASKAHIRTAPTYSQLQKRLGDFSELKDAEFALVSSAVLHSLFARFFKSKLRKLALDDEKRLFDAGQNGCLSSFSNQVRVAFALGWLEPYIYEDLLLLNDIRNVFAHTAMKIDFTDSLIEDDCKKLWLSKIIMSAVAERISGKKPDVPVARVAFNNAIVMYCLFLRQWALGKNCLTQEGFKAMATEGNWKD